MTNISYIMMLISTNFIRAFFLIVTCVIVALFTYILLKKSYNKTIKPDFDKLKEVCSNKKI